MSRGHSATRLSGHVRPLKVPNQFDGLHYRIVYKDRKDLDRPYYGIVFFFAFPYFVL